MFHPIKQSDMEALAAYQRQLWKHPKLRYLFFELTDKCNLHCRHCGSGCTEKNHAFLPYAEIEKILHSVAEHYEPRSIMICLTGGEPLLYLELYKVIAKARSLGFPIGITTNGTLIDEKAARCLAQADMNTVAVSLDGLKSEHEALRLSDGCFEKAVAGISALQRSGFFPQVITVVHRNNLSSLDALYQYLLRLGVDSWRLVSIDPIGRANVNRELLLNGGELKQLFAYIRSKRFDDNNPMEVTYGCSHFASLTFEREIRDFYFQCGAGTMVASVTAHGNIRACLDIERRPDLIQGNIYRDDFIDVWGNRFQAFRTDRTEKSEICRDCQWKSICLGDSAHTWDYDNYQPRYCAAKLIGEG